MVSVGPVLKKYFSNDLAPLSHKDAKAELELVKSGDTEARVRLFESCVRLATVIARNISKKQWSSVLSLDDFLQEAYREVWENIHLWNTDYPLKTWLGYRLKSVLYRTMRTGYAGNISDYTWRKLIHMRRLEIGDNSDLTRQEQVELLFKPFGKVQDVVGVAKLHNAESIYSKFDDCATRDIAHNDRISIGSIPYCLRDIERLLKICVTNPKRQELFCRRYGLKKFKPHSVPKLQKLYNMTYREVMYQIDLAVKEMYEYVHDIDRKKKCAQCGKEFTCHPKHPDAKTCSRQCSRKYFYVTKKQKRNCECCGEEFLARNDQRFCSTKCNKRAAYRRKNGKPIADVEYAKC